ncbi:MAG: glycerate kinase [Oscillospiraceae bacterium]|nr:glycerate kinase [Oscillospiraceae bacterium]
MKKAVLIPDSFKGTMSSSEICAIMKEEIQSFYPEAEVLPVPVADGGEGSVDSFLAAVGGEKRTVLVKGPYFEDMEGFYGILPDGAAVIEMAAAAGLPLVGDNKRADQTTTYGVGQLMACAASSGCKKMIVGLGGSATNDGGCGAAAALGIVFRNAKGEAFVPVGGTLDQIASIDVSGLLPALKDVEIITMCDIDNPLCGPNGASAVFGPQKGADTAMVQKLDQNLQHLADVVKRDLGKKIAELPGSGAAGGMGGGMVAFFGARLQMGIETVLDTVHFDELARDADLVFSGEGKIDTQSLRGKVVIGVARRTKKLGVPLVAVVGDIGDNIEAAYDQGVSAIFSTNRVAVPYSQAKERAKSDMALTINNLMRCWKTFGTF